MQLLKKPFRILKRLLHNQAQIADNTSEMRELMRIQTEIMNRRLGEMNEVIHYLAAVAHKQSGLEMADAAATRMASNGLNVNNGYQAPPFRVVQGGASGGNSYQDAMGADAPLPLVFARNTYNPSHQNYDANVVRNFAGKAMNTDVKIDNVVWDELKRMMKGDEIPEKRWASIIKQTLEEAKSVPGADQVFERKQYVEDYLAKLEKENNAHYRPGWVNVDDAVFLYWVIRTLKPKVIVQTGVCNGLSSAFMMLALAKNGPDGTLHVVDMPPVYDSTDDIWKIKGKMYGVTIPEGKTSGWLVPDIYKDRFEVLNGDAKVLLPELLERLGKCDMFYHDSDHTYDHMIFEFEESKKYLSERGVVVSDDIAWNASLWDFADKYNVPSYNYRGSMGIACF